MIGAAGEPEAVPILVNAARDRGVASLVVIGQAEIDALAAPLGMAGRYQRQNAACALALASACAARLGRSIGEEARAAGLVTGRLPGRLELISSDPVIVADGAHNPHAARALAAELEADGAPPGGWVAILGLSGDKDVAGVIGPIAARAVAIVATASTHERALPPGEVAAAARALVPAEAVHQAPDLAAALELARSLVRPDGAILIAGSLFLVGEARGLLLGEASDPIAAFDPVR